MSTKQRLRIAIQKSGRLYQSSLDLLAARGLIFLPNGRSLSNPCANRPIDLLYLRDDDIPEYVERGIADLGIVGENVLAEKGRMLPIVSRLDFGICRLVIAAPQNSDIWRPQDLVGRRIATSYPKLLAAYLEKENVKACIVPISGSAEITPRLGLADAVCDIVQTGATLKAHDLVPLFTVMESQAVLVKSPTESTRKEEFLPLFTKVLL